MRHSSFQNQKAFSLVELLIVIGIISILSGVIIPAIGKAREKAIAGRALNELRSMETALYLYYNDYEHYPPDASRNVPPGLEPYLAGQNVGDWPKAPYPGSVYDWDSWEDPDTGEPIYQISIRFCPVGSSVSECQFPDEPWAENFGVNSAEYFCISGPCRSHIGEPVTYPGYCVNCDVQPSAS